MGTTPNYGLPYPESAGHVRLWEYFEPLATAVDSALLAGLTRRVGTSKITSNSAGFTNAAEVSLGSVAPTLVAGVTYVVKARIKLDTSVADDSVDVRIREDSVAGTEMILGRVDLKDNTGRWPADLEADYTPGSSGAKTFVVTGIRVNGTGGTIVLSASATIPSYLYVERV